MARLTVSIVVGRDTRVIGPCIDTLMSALGPHDASVIVTCSAAVEDVVRTAVATWPGVRMVVHPRLPGFATNHNHALRGASGDYYLVANDDVEFRSGSIARCIGFLERAENRRVGALTPRLVNPDGSLQPSTYSFPTVFRALLDLSGLREWIPDNMLTRGAARFLGYGSGRSRFWRHDQTCDVETFRGAAMFVRPAAWQAAGELSEATRCGGEIAEWHQRCANLRFRRVFFADAEVMHWGSLTVGADRLLANEYLKGYLVHFSRHHSRLSYHIFRLLALPVAAARLGAAILRQDQAGAALRRMNIATLLAPPLPAETLSAE